MLRYNFHSIETKWQKIFENQKLYKDKKKIKNFIV